MSFREQAAIAAVRNGDLGPLADLLAEEGELHPLIQRELNIMITGWASRDFRLALVPAVHRRQTGRALRAQRDKEIRLTGRALDLGAAERGKRDGAVLQAAEEAGVNAETAMTWFKRRQRAVRTLRHHT